MAHFFAFVKALLKFRDYRPQPLTLLGLQKWAGQFDKDDRKAIVSLLDRVIYFSEKDTKRILLEQNDALLRKLTAAGVPYKKIVYVQMHDPGSSSALMLNMLRDAAGLEQLGCKFVDWRDGLKTTEMTNRLGDGALVYVDDFVATGGQFSEVRDFFMQKVIGTFPEFLLVPSVCEEAVARLGALGVEIAAGHVHSRAERPLHNQCPALKSDRKERIVEICRSIDKKAPLGFGDIAAMVVFYRNAPDNVPVILRGNAGQDRFIGVFPRSTDLPKRHP